MTSTSTFKFTAPMKKEAKGVRWNKTVPPSPPTTTSSTNCVELQQQLKQTAQTYTPLAHFSYTCPGLHGPGCIQHIHRMTFGQLFHLSMRPEGFLLPYETSNSDPQHAPTKKKGRLVIPLFQRTYCWVPKVIAGWWRDAAQCTVMVVPDSGDGDTDDGNNKRQKTPTSSSYDFNNPTNNGMIGDHNTGKVVVKTIRVFGSGDNDDDDDDDEMDLSDDDDKESGVDEVITLTRLPDHIAAHARPTITPSAVVAPTSEGNIVTVVIDGQQRITTTMLLLAAIHDTTVESIRKLQRRQESLCGARRKRTTSRARTLSSNEKNALREGRSLVRKLESLLFIDVVAYHKWVESTVATLLSHGGGGNDNNSNDDDNDDNDNDNDASPSIQHAWLTSVHLIGKDLPFSTLCPSLVDRAAFYEMITIGGVRDSLDAKIHATRNNSDNNSSSNNSSNNSSNGSSSSSSSSSSTKYDQLLTPSEKAMATHQGYAKRYFTDCIRSRVRPSAAGGDGDDDDDDDGDDVSAMLVSQLKYLSELTHRASEGMSLMCVETVNPINFAQVFLWFQEKTLFGMGGLLHNPSPGIAFRACDLVRNLLLSPFMNLKLSKQERILKTRWLVPIEMRLGSDSTRVDSLLWQYLDSVGGMTDGRHVGTFEKTVQQLLGVLKQSRTSNPEKHKAIVLYSRFQSHWEGLRILKAKAVAARDVDNTTATPDTASTHTDTEATPTTAATAASTPTDPMASATIEVTVQDERDAALGLLTHIATWLDDELLRTMV